MVEGIEGIGEAVTGGMIGRAVEPAAGESGDIGTRNCLNCGVALDGSFCRQCGQKAHVHRSVSTIAHDLIHGILHLDGKFWRTLPLLFWRPGELTRRYVQGERAKFVSPMAMFLFSVFLMFAVLSVYGLSLSSLDDNARGGRIQHTMDQARAGIVRELEGARRNRSRIARGEMRRYRGAPESLPQIDARIAETERGLVEFDRIRATTSQFGPGARENNAIQTGWSRLDYGLQKMSDNPGLALYKLQSNGYKFSWALIPLSVPFVWLLFFWTRRFHIYDHTVFVTYSIAFMSLLAILLTVLGFAGVPVAIIAPAALVVPPIHMFRQLKGAYRLHWASALVRTLLLVSFCFITAVLYFILLLGLGALG